MLRTLWRDHREFLVMLFGVFCYGVGTSMEYFSPGEKFPYGHDIGYSIWVASYCYWFVISNKKGHQRDMQIDENTIALLVRYSELDVGRIRYFVPGESDHTTVNWIRKLRGKKTIRLFCGGYNEDSSVISRTSYVLSDKDIFQMRLRGYNETISKETAFAALNDKWLKKRRGWVS